MTSPSSRAQTIHDHASQGDFDAFDSLWIEVLESAPEQIDIFLSGIDGLESRGHRGKAGVYLSLLVPTLLERSLNAEALTAALRMVEVARGELDAEERGVVIEAFRRVHADHPQLETYITSSGVETAADLRAACDKLATCLSFREGRYLVHPAGWGTGIVREVLPEQTTVVIDFDGKKGHRISMEMARKVTEFIERDDLRALLLDRRDELEILLESDPLRVVHSALISRRGKATLREIRDRLVPQVLDTRGWTRWWQKARLQVKASGAISMTPGSNPTLQLREIATSYPQGCLVSLGQLTTDPRRVRYFRDLLKEAQDHEDGPQAIRGVAAALLGPSGDAEDLEYPSRISLAFLLADAKKRDPAIEIPESLIPQNLLEDAPEVVEALPGIPIAAHRTRALMLLRTQVGSTWDELCEQVILRGDSETCEYCLEELKRHGRIDLLQHLVQTLLDGYRETPRAFHWLVRAIGAGRLPAAVRVPGWPSLLEKTLILHTHLAGAVLRDESEELKGVARSLGTMLQARDYAMVRRAFEDSTLSEALNLAALVRNNRSLKQDAYDKITATMYRAVPALARSDKPTLESTDPMAALLDSKIIYTTEQALMKKRQEYERLVNEEIPENAAAIGVAASHGDLSENAEWSAAIEKQGQLTRRSEEIGTDISRARVIKRSMQDGVRVTLGSRVRVVDADGREREYSILGPWDADEAHGRISYQSPLGHALLGKKVEQIAELEVPAGKISLRVLEISDGLPSD